MSDSEFLSSAVFIYNYLPINNRYFVFFNEICHKAERFRESARGLEQDPGSGSLAQY